VINRLARLQSWCCIPPPSLGHIWDVGLEEGEYSILYYCNGAQWHEQFLQVIRLDQALILLGLALYLPSVSVSSVFICSNFFLVTSFSCLIVSWASRDWLLTWLTNLYPSVVWHCWLSHLTRKIISEIMYYVLSGTLNSTVPYHTIPLCCCFWLPVCVAMFVCYILIKNLLLLLLLCNRSHATFKRCI